MRFLLLAVLLFAPACVTNDVPKETPKKEESKFPLAERQGRRIVVNMVINRENIPEAYMDVAHYVWETFLDMKSDGVSKDLYFDPIQYESDNLPDDLIAEFVRSFERQFDAKVMQDHPQSQFTERLESFRSGIRKALNDYERVFEQ